MAEIDVAVFTFDPARKLRLVNRAGEILLKKSMDKLLGRTARELRLDVCLDADEDAPLTLAFPGATGRWGVRRSTFREQGLPNELLVLTDLSRTLREEERIAWQRLVRVLGHAERVAFSGGIRFVDAVASRGKRKRAWQF